MDAPDFKDFPWSYRMAQRSMLAAVGMLYFLLKIARIPGGAPLIWGIAALAVGVILFALVIAAYVVVRYPYLSLVSARDGDVFSSQIRSTFLLWILKSVGLLALIILVGVLVVVALEKGGEKPLLYLVLAYFVVLVLFVLYLCFWYDPTSSPTIATFMRSTLGIGIVLIPLFLPVLVVGSVRCRRLLGEESTRQENEVSIVADPNLV